MNLTQIGFEDMDWFYLAKRPVAQRTLTSHSRHCISWPAGWPYISKVRLFFLGVSYNVILQGPLQNLGTYKSGNPILFVSCSLCTTHAPLEKGFMKNILTNHGKEHNIFPANQQVWCPYCVKQAIVSIESNY